MKSASMEKKKKTNLKRKKESVSRNNNIAAKLQKVRNLVAETMPVDVKQTMSASSDFSPNGAKKNRKASRSLRAEVQLKTPTPQILTTKSDLNVSKPTMSNRSPSPKFEPLMEETEIKQEKNKRKEPRTISPNAQSPGNHSPNRHLTTVVHKPESKSPKKSKRHASPTKMEQDSNAAFAEIIRTRFPILKDEELMKRFHNVTMTNNQKGRIRQTLKDIFQGTAPSMLPDIIYNKIQHILQSKETLTDSDLRKIRVLYNMLKVATDIETRNTGKHALAHSVKKESVYIKKELPESLLEVLPVRNQKVQTANKQRYVVFIGNLPLDVDKDELLSHFDEFRMYIKDLRIPPPKEGKKSAIAYLELSTEPAYEMALSKHHTMFCNRRINVLYSKQQNSKMSKAEAKAKAAKMVALVKSGQLVGSQPLKKKRSHRRAIMRRAQKEANDHALMVTPN